MLFSFSVLAAPRTPLEVCLQRADDLPDLAAAEANVWLKQGGGNDARLCHAFAQVNRGLHQEAAREFRSLAAVYARHEKHHAVTMYDLSGQEFLAAGDIKNAETQYAAALKIAPQSADSHIGRARLRMAQERYWDAIDDLNRALKTEPGNIDALRQRGRAWMQLGNEGNAKEDFNRAATLADPPLAPQQSH